MYKTMRNTIAIIALALIFNLTSAAQQSSPSPAKSDDDLVSQKDADLLNQLKLKQFKGKVFDVKHRDVASLANALRTLGSGFSGSGLVPNAEFKTLTVRDFPENIAAIEEALKRLDTPTIPNPDIVLHMYVLIGSNTAATTTTAVPAELKDVIPQLRSTLSYKNYDLATSLIQRINETREKVAGSGTMEISSPTVSGGVVTVPYSYQIFALTTAQNAGATPIVKIGSLSFSTGITTGSTINDGTSIQTSLNLREGEKVVVGTATLRDRALIVVLTANLVN